jgi:hypothetical protein
MKKFCALIVLLAFCLVGCQARIPKEALELSPESLQMRHLQTRHFETNDEQKLLVSSAGLLQDLGFNIDESEIQLGYLLGTKERNAISAAQVTGAVLVALLGGGVMAIDKTQKMRACVVTHPSGESGDRISVRVTFQRIVWNTQGQITTRECIENPEVYQEFFTKLSKAVFLEANQI